MRNCFWDKYASWEEAELAWDLDSFQEQPFQPNVPGVTDRRFLRLRALSWVLARDKKFAIFRLLLRRPWKYAIRYVRSLFRRPPYVRSDDFYCFGVRSVSDILALMEEKNTLFVLGFSYCQKPKECPSSRFSDACLANPDNAVCRRCFIGKCLHTLPKSNTVPIIIPTINAIGHRMMELVDTNEGRKIIFVITACEMAIEMFGDFSNMVGCQGVGVRLGGRFCNTWQAFELSEEGVKPGVTALPLSAQKGVLAILRYWRECHNGKKGKKCSHGPVADGNEW